MSTVVMWKPTDFPWKPLVRNASCAVLFGDPQLEGSLYVIRFKTEGNINVPPHWHAHDENVTVLAGSFRIAFGDVFNESALKSFPPQSYIRVPERVHHYAAYADGTIVQVTGIGPFESIYVNPADSLGDLVAR